MAQVIVTPALLDALNSGFKAIFQEWFKGVAPKWNRVAMEVMSTAAIETYGWLKAMPRMREWVGDRVLNTLDATGQVLANKDYETTIALPRNQIEDDVLGIFRNIVADLGMKSAQFPDELVFLQTLLQGFAKTCYDGQNFFDANHPSKDSSGNPILVSNMQAGAGPAWYLLHTKGVLKPLIFQNRKKFEFIARVDPKSSDPTFMRKEYHYGVDGRCAAGYGLWQMAFGSKAALNTANFRAARAIMMGLNDDSGRPLGFTPDLLVVPTGALADAARDLLLADRLPNGASNTDYKLVEILEVEWLPQT